MPFIYLYTEDVKFPITLGDYIYQNKHQLEQYYEYQSRNCEQRWKTIYERTDVPIPERSNTEVLHALALTSNRSNGGICETTDNNSRPTKRKKLRHVLLLNGERYGGKFPSYTCSYWNGEFNQTDYTTKYITTITSTEPISELQVEWPIPREQPLPELRICQKRQTEGEPQSD